MKYPLLSFYITYLCAVSLIAIFAAVSDKIKAKLGKWRISESALLTISAFGGAFAMFTAMLLIRHKTRHTRFMAGLPIMILFHLILSLGILRLSGII